jgi:hypothetical protein
VLAHDDAGLPPTITTLDEHVINCKLRWFLHLSFPSTSKSENQGLWVYVTTGNRGISSPTERTHKPRVSAVNANGKAYRAGYPVFISNRKCRPLAKVRVDPPELYCLSNSKSAYSSSFVPCT